MGTKETTITNNNNSKIINIELNKIDYFKGENIAGEIILNVGFAPISFHQINISFYLNEGWYYETTSDDSTVLYSDENNITLKSFQLNVRELLNKNPNQDLITLNQGNYFLPFNYTLSNFISPTCEYYMNGGRGYLRYYLIAELISPYSNSNENNEIYKKIIIVKSQPKILKTPLVYSKESEVKKWGLFNEGKTILHVTYYKNYGVFDEMIPITVTVDNTNSDLDVTLIKIVLIRNINFHKCNQKPSFSFKSNVFSLKNNVSIKKNSKETFNYQINLKDNNLRIIKFYKIDDPYPSNIDLNYLLPTVNGNLIRCDYSIKISCEYDSFVTYNNRPRVFLPIYIGHQGTSNIYDSIENIDYNKEPFMNMEELKPENDKMFDDFVVVDDNLNKKEYKSEIVKNNIDNSINDIKKNENLSFSVPPFVEQGNKNNNYYDNNFNQNNNLNYNYNEYQNNNYNNSISYNNDNQNNNINYNPNNNQYNNSNNYQNNNSNKNLYYNNISNNDIQYINYIQDKSQNYNQNNYYNNNINYNNKLNYYEQNQNKLPISNNINSSKYNNDINYNYPQNISSNNNINENEKKDDLKSHKSSNKLDAFLNDANLNNDSISLNSNGVIEQFLNGPYPINNNEEYNKNENI